MKNKTRKVLVTPPGKGRKYPMGRISSIFKVIATALARQAEVGPPYASIWCP